MVKIGLKLNASVKFKCIIEEKALVTPQVGHNIPVAFRIRQTDPSKKNSVGIIIKDKKNIR